MREVWSTTKQRPVISVEDCPPYSGGPNMWGEHNKLA